MNFFLTYKNNPKNYYQINHFGSINDDIRDYDIDDLNEKYEEHIYLILQNKNFEKRKMY